VGQIARLHLPQGDDLMRYVPITEVLETVTVSETHQLFKNEIVICEMSF
jgi:hypothetical protein